jgi:hypothetical protein
LDLYRAWQLAAAKAALRVRFDVGVTDGGLAQEGKLPLKVFNFGSGKRLVGHGRQILALSSFVRYFESILFV